MDDRTEILLKEYQWCQETVQHLESRIWTTSSIIGIGAIGAFAAALVRTNGLSTPVVTILGCLVVPSCWIWWKIAQRWWDIQHATLARMRDIEVILDIYHKRYIDFRDGTLPVPDNFTGDQKRILGYSPKIGKRGVQKNIRYLPWLITIVWAGTLIYVLLGGK